MESGESCGAAEARRARAVTAASSQQQPPQLSLPQLPVSSSPSLPARVAEASAAAAAMILAREWQPSLPCTPSPRTLSPPRTPCASGSSQASPLPPTPLRSLPAPHSSCSSRASPSPSPPLQLSPRFAACARSVRAALPASRIAARSSTRAEGSVRTRRRAPRALCMHARALLARRLRVVVLSGASGHVERGVCG